MQVFSPPRSLTLHIFNSLAFTSIGDLSVSMRSDMEPYLDAIVKAIKEGLSSKE